MFSSMVFSHMSQIVLVRISRCVVFFLSSCAATMVVSAIRNMLSKVFMSGLFGWFGFSVDGETKATVEHGLVGGSPDQGCVKIRAERILGGNDLLLLQGACQVLCTEVDLPRAQYTRDLGVQRGIDR